MEGGGNLNFMKIPAICGPYLTEPSFESPAVSAVLLGAQIRPQVVLFGAGTGR